MSIIPNSNRIIHGTGSEDAVIVFVGERPGKDENRVGRPFVGKSGVELRRYLWKSCHIDLDDCFRTNLVRDYGPNEKDQTPTIEEIRRDEHYLVEELEGLSRVECIVPLGQYSTRWFLGDWADMDCVNGIASSWKHELGQRFVLPIYHPAAGMHNTEFQQKIWWGFEQLNNLLKAEPELKWLINDAYPEPEYGDDDHVPEIQAKTVAVDTEGSGSRPWGLSWATIPGRAHVVRSNIRDRRVDIATPVSSRPPLLDVRGRANGRPSIGGPDTRYVLHNSLHDLEVLRGLGIELEDGSYDDTMVKAYELGIEPQGLKSLARRHCGMVMSEYQEILGPASKRLALDYLNAVINWLNKMSDSE